MSKRGYTHIQAFLPEIKVLLSSGYTQQEAADHLGLKDKTIIKELLKRERRKEAKLAAGIVPRPKGRPRKGDGTSEEDYQYEIKCLQMENRPLRDFLQLTGRK